MACAGFPRALSYNSAQIVITKIVRFFHSILDWLWPLHSSKHSFGFRVMGQHVTGQHYRFIIYCAFDVSTFWIVYTTAQLNNVQVWYKRTHKKKRHCRCFSTTDEWQYGSWEEKTLWNEFTQHMFSCHVRNRGGCKIIKIGRLKQNKTNFMLSHSL